jgi:hypothetical protein
VSEKYGPQWFKLEDPRLPIGPPVPNQEGGIHCPAINKWFCLGSNLSSLLSWLNYFFLIFPPDQFAAMIKLSNLKFMAQGKEVQTKSVFLKFIGVVMLYTSCFEFGERVPLWSSTAWNKYQSAACFGKIEMIWKCFDEIWGNLTFSHQLEQRPVNASSETYLWQHVKETQSLANHSIWQTLG